MGEIGPVVAELLGGNAWRHVGNEGPKKHLLTKLTL